MIDTIWNLLFRCQHRRKTFPLTPARTKGADHAQKQGDTYVVCLDCGKQFVYDWDKMRLGGAVDISDEPAAPAPALSKVPFRTKSKVRYLVWGSALSAAVILGKAAQSRKRAKSAADQNGKGDSNQDTKTPRSS